LRLGLELTRRHRILMWVWLVVRIVPLLHVLLHLRWVGRCMRRAIVLRVMVGGIGIVMDRRVGLGRHMVVLMVGLPPARMMRPGRRDVRARHHSGAVLPSQSRCR